ncbi:hypothetical protein [Candidatus Amarolinea aalborgensis]|jgi:hypothetical protein|uniref:hypothetical protein n=1 Tax=Candidatus Amarolinea aalborgensis TaxID=2249329 RepID=UPI003BF9A2C2
MNPEDHAHAALAKMFAIAKAQFGSAVKSQWFYVGDGCPGCGRAVGAVKYKGEDTLSLNAFIYRPRGVLIGYLLCERCARQMLAAGQRKPAVQTPLHATIEQTLIQAYQRYLGSLDA